MFCVLKVIQEHNQEIPKNLNHSCRWSHLLLKRLCLVLISLILKGNTTSTLSSNQSTISLRESKQRKRILRMRQEKSELISRCNTAVVGELVSGKRKIKACDSKIIQSQESIRLFFIFSKSSSLSYPSLTPLVDISWTFKLIEISKEENEHDVIEEMEDRCCGSPGL